MFISEIIIKNFRSHLQTQVAGLGRFNIFLGPNGAGKSSILDAVAYALVGVCRGTDDGGRGAEDLSRQDQGRKSIPGTVLLKTDRGEIVRQVGQGPKSQAHLRVVQGIQGDMAFLRLVVQPGRFLELPERDQKAALLATLAQAIDAKDVRSILGEDLLAYVPNAQALTTAAAVEEMEACARAKRPLLKRDLQNLVYVPQDGLPNLPAGQGLGAALAEAKAKLTALRSQRDAAMREAMQARLGREALAADAQACERESADLAERLRKLPPEAKLRELAKTLRAEVERGRAADAKQQQFATEIEGNLAACRAELDHLSSQSARLRAIGVGRCPTCLQGVTKQIVDTLINNELKPKIAALSIEIKKQERRLLASQQSDLTAWAKQQEDLIACEKAMVEHEQLAPRQAAVKADLAAIQARLAQPSPVQAANPGDHDRQIAEVEQRVEQLQALAAEDRRRAEVLGRRQTVETELALIERLVTVLGPGGPLRTRLMAGGTQAFEAEVTALLAHFGLPALRVSVDPFGLRVGNLPAALLSTSEQYRMSLALAGVFAKRSGLGMLCLDGAEVLDGENRGLLPDVLAACGLNQAIVAATADSPYAGTAMPEWSFYWVEKGAGEVSSVTASAAPVAA